MSEIAVSVIVPVYNTEKYLRKCLDSLVKQTLKDLEIIIVNDGSKDNSQVIIDEYTERFPKRVRAFIKENGGQSSARNFGITQAKGKYVGFVDSDDYVNPTMYQKLYTKGESENADIVQCALYQCYEDCNEYLPMHTNELEEFGKSLAENPKLLYLTTAYPCDKIYRMDLLKRTGITFPEGLIHEDKLLNWELFLHARKISGIGEPLYFYIIKRAGATTATHSYKQLQMFTVMAKVNDYYRQQGVFGKYADELCYVNLKHVLFRFRDFADYNNLSLKKAMIDQGFAHLNHYFPNWSKNEIFQKRDKSRLLKKVLAHKALWYLYMLIPAPFLKSLMKRRRKRKLAESKAA